MTDYISQDKAQQILDALEAIDSVYLNSSENTITSKVLKEARETIRQEYLKYIGHSANQAWCVELKRNKRVLVWNKNYKECNS